MLATDVIDWNALGQVVVYSLVAGIGVPAVYALAVLGASKSTDPNRRRGGATSAIYVILALVGAAACLGSIVYGIYLMTQK
jgi:hypothetical protein